MTLAELRVREIPARRVTVEPAEGEHRFFFLAAETSHRSAARPAALRSRDVRAMHRRPGVLKRLRKSRRENDAGLDILLLDLVEIKQSKFHVPWIGVGEGRQRPQIGVAKVPQAEHPECARQIFDRNAERFGIADVQIRPPQRQPNGPACGLDV